MKKIFVLLPLACLVSQSVGMDRSHRMAMGKACGRTPVCYDKAPDRLMLTGDPRLEPSAEFIGGFSVSDDLGTQTLAVALSAALLFAQATAFAPGHGPQFVPRKDWDGALPRGFGRGDVATPSKSHAVEPLGGVANATEPSADNRGSCCTPPSYDECYHECVKVGCSRCGIEKSQKSHCHLTCASCPSLQKSIAKLNDRIYSIAEKSGDLRTMHSEVQTTAEAVAGLIRCGAPLEERGETGLTALMTAACGGHALLTECLLKSGANASAVDHNGFTAFDFAVMSSIPPQSNIFAMVPWAATKEFCQPGRFETMKLLMKYSHAKKNKIKKRIVELVELTHGRDSEHDKIDICAYIFKKLFGEE